MRGEGVGVGVHGVGEGEVEAVRVDRRGGGAGERQVGSREGK